MMQQYQAAVKGVYDCRRHWADGKVSRRVGDATCYGNQLSWWVLPLEEDWSCCSQGIWQCVHAEAGHLLLKEFHISALDVEVQATDLPVLSFWELCSDVNQEALCWFDWSWMVRPVLYLGSFAHKCLLSA